MWLQVWLHPVGGEVDVESRYLISIHVYKLELYAILQQK